MMSTCMQGRSSVAISVPLSKRMMRRIRATRTILNIIGGKGSTMSVANWSSSEVATRKKSNRFQLS